MIDYKATLQSFFTDTEKYLENLRKKAKDEVAANKITAAIDLVQRVAKDPKKYSDYQARSAEGLEGGDFATAFIPAGTFDNRVYLSFAAVVNSMGKLYSTNDYEREEAQKKLLNALKFVKYKTSTNFLKDFTFSFKSPKSFAIKKENNR